MKYDINKPSQRADWLIILAMAHLEYDDYEQAQVALAAHKCNGNGHAALKPYAGDNALEMALTSVEGFQAALVMLGIPAPPGLEVRDVA